MEIINYKKYPKVRDIKDIPLLAYAIESKAEMFITGDKDFDEIDVENLQIITPKEYLEKYIK